MNEEILTNEMIQEMLIAARQNVGSVPDLKVSLYDSEADARSILCQLRRGLGAGVRLHG